MRKLNLSELVPDVVVMIRDFVSYANEGVLKEGFDIVIEELAAEGRVMIALAQIGPRVGRCINDPSQSSVLVHELSLYDLNPGGCLRLSRAPRREDFRPEKSELGECAFAIFEFCELAGWKPELSACNKNNLWEIRLPLDQFRALKNPPLLCD